MSSLLLIITGASRGLGPAIANAFVHKAASMPYGSVRALLVARSKEGLSCTEQQMSETAVAETFMNPPLSLDVSSHVMDLSNVDQLDLHIDELLNRIGKPMDQYDRTVLVNNAGSLGHLGPLTEMTSLSELSRYIEFNVTCSLWLSVRFAKEMMAATMGNPESSSLYTIVNISSKCAVEALPTMGMYCSGKAARDMFHEALAKEVGHPSRLKILNYAPGALETDMTHTLRTAPGLDPALQSFFREAHEAGELIPPERTAQRMVELILNNNFVSGEHVDYWDLPSLD